MKSKDGKESQMRRKQLARIALSALGFAIVLLFSFVREARAFYGPDLLNVQIRATAIKGESIDQVLGRLTEYGIPLGIELAEEKLSPRREIELNLPETNLKDFLDSVIAKDPRYTWKLEAAVVHIWPVKGRDTFVASLLDLKISHFAIVGSASRYTVFKNIMDLPEVSSQLVIGGVEPMIFLASGSMARLGKETLFKETSLTLRELLDKIVLQTEIRLWVIMRWGKNSEYITLKSG